jgi:hypothetical protein
MPSGTSEAMPRAMRPRDLVRFSLAPGLNPVGNCGHNAVARISAVKLPRRLTLFDWLNPWWHRTFVIPVPLEP